MWTYVLTIDSSKTNIFFFSEMDELSVKLTNRYILKHKIF